MNWLRRRDRGLVALRRAARTALVMPSAFALGNQAIGDPTVATFAAFGSFALLLLVDFGGTRRARVRAQAWLVVTGAVFVCLGTLASARPVVAAVAMALVAFGVLFAGVVSSVLAGARTALLLSFILPVSLPGPAGSIPERLAGWGIAGAASLLAVAFLWPAPARDPVRSAAIDACRALAERLRSGAEVSDAAVEALRATFYATPYRPTGLSTSARAVIRLVDELQWLSSVTVSPDASTRAVITAAAAVLDEGAAVLDAPGRGSGGLRDAMASLRFELEEFERRVMRTLPVGDGATARDDVVSSLDPGFRAQEVSFMALQIAGNVELAAAAERRRWVDQLLGRMPAGGALSAASERAGSHIERHSQWLQSSVRGAAGLGLAVLIADLTGVQHAFWVVLGTLSVLRSNALSTGQDVVRGLLGTVAGFVVGGLIVALVGTNTALLWALLPPAILLAGLAPAAVGFATGQAAFTLTLLIVFNLLAPAGWQIGLVRIEDVALGCAVSLAVGLAFWPRGAGAALGTALADAYDTSARYLAAAVLLGASRCDSAGSDEPAPAQEAARAAAAARRLDDTFRVYLAERGAKPLPLADVSSLVAGVTGLRLAADAVLDLWRVDGAGGDRSAARRELVSGGERIAAWYAALGASLVSDAAVPAPQPRDPHQQGRLVEAVGRDLRGDDGAATAIAVRMIWTGDHLDAARRLEAMLAGPARAAVSQEALSRPARERRRGRVAWSARQT